MTRDDNDGLARSYLLHKNFMYREKKEPLPATASQLASNVKTGSRVVRPQRQASAASQYNAHNRDPLNWNALNCLIAFQAAAMSAFTMTLSRRIL